MSTLTNAQRQIVENLSASLCVTSGAGCGKTSVLVARYIRFLEQDLTLPLQRLAAITFTENAAAEMRDRIRRACRRQVEDARKARDPARMDIWHRRYWDVDIAPIDTIHSFCSALLRLYPIEARVDPAFSLLDEAEAALLRADVVAARFEELLERKDADLLAVLEHHSLTQARATFAEILGEKREVLRRLTAPVMGRSDAEILAALKEAAGTLSRRLLAECTAGPEFAAAVHALEGTSGDAADRREQMRRETIGKVRALLRARTPQMAREAAGWLADNINLQGGSPRRWPSEAAYKAASAAMNAIRDMLKKAMGALPAYDEQAERRHLALARAFYATSLRIIEAYESAKSRQSRLDFEDLQIRARDLLRNNPAVLEECRQRFRAILVDELQDTNSLQWEIVNLLVSAGGPARKKPPLRPAALFGVGDPKQSIYRFRGAEVEVFHQVLARVGREGRRGLTASFRLHGGGAALVNHLFPDLMGDGYEPVEGRREQRNAAVGECLIVLEPKGKPLDAAAGHAEEAARLAARLREIVAAGALTVEDADGGTWRPARYGDIAVIFRRMTYLHLYEEALERCGVPYYVVAGAGFYKQQEVIDAVNLLRVLDDPADDLHLAGVLRSPFFAVSDEGLYRLRALGPSLYHALAAGARADRLAEEDRRGIARAAALLPQWAAAKDRLGLASLIEQAVFNSGYAAASVGRFGGARAYANLGQMAELARQFDRRGLYALADYVEYVTDFMQSEMRMEQAPIEAPGGDTLRLMTIHKAKGLEFPIVAVPDLGYSPRGPAAPYVLHPVGGLAVRTRDEEAAAGDACAMALARHDEAAAQREENWRLLYVAMTRARDYLLLSSHDSSRAPPEDSWLDAILRGLGADRTEGDRDLRLPSGHVLRLSAHPPKAEKTGPGKRRGGPRDVFADGRVLWDRLHDRGARSARRAAGALAQVAPPPVPVRAPARIAATALATYARCPRLYWWTEVLGVDQPEAAPAAAGLSPRHWGVVSHRAFELAASARPADVHAAVEGALREADIGPGPARDQLGRRLLDALDAFWHTPLGRRVTQARRAHREMPFIFRLDNTEIRGTMDLLFEGADGAWELVDYKSAAPTVDAAGAPGTTHEFQSGLYALAAGRWLGRPVTRWTVYFLGCGVESSHDAVEADLQRAASRAREVLAAIGAGQFDARPAAGCRQCPFGRICDRGAWPACKTRKGGGDDLRLLRSP
jgi:ATP-dependent helicase/nuclease subunit A